VLVSALVLCTCALAQSPVFLPMLYVTPAPSYNYAGNVNYWVLPLCSNMEYDGLIAEVRVSLPFAPWSSSSGQIVYMSVTDANGNVIANNTQTGTTDLRMSFPYTSSYGDLTIQTRTGNAPNVVFTLSVQFTTKTGLSYVPHEMRTKNAAPSAPPTQDFLPWKNEHPFAAQTDPKAMATYRLIQVITDGQTFSIPTNPNTPGILIDYYYCGNPDTPKIQIITTVNSLDDQSAFSTYLCMPNQLPCAAGTALVENSDPRGIAINTVVLNTNSNQYNAIEAAIYGWGNYGGKNTFSFTVNVS